MLMRDKDMAKRCERHIGASQLDSHAIAAIDNVGQIINNNYL